MEKSYFKEFAAPQGSGTHTASPDGSTAPDTHTTAQTAKFTGPGHSLGALTGGLGNALRSLALDDIILLALILFLLGSDTDDNLPVILLIILFITGFQKDSEE